MSELFGGSYNVRDITNGLSLAGRIDLLAQDFWKTAWDVPPASCVPIETFNSKVAHWVVEHLEQKLVPCCPTWKKACCISTRFDLLGPSRTSMEQILPSPCLETIALLLPSSRSRGGIPRFPSWISLWQDSLRWTCPPFPRFSSWLPTMRPPRP